MGGYFGKKTSISALVVLVAITANHYRNIKTLSPVVEISTGKLQGVVSYSRGGKEVHEYLKIPFAQQPVGELRYEPPQPAEPWTGILDASETGPQCIQVNLISGKVEGSEECLHLNVFTPAKRGKPLPVMLWCVGTGLFLAPVSRQYMFPELPFAPVLLGTCTAGNMYCRETGAGNNPQIRGAFVFGTGTRYKPAYLLDEDVILVTTNYRLASMGFLNTGDGVVRGNMGLKDQNLAMKWVQENIKYFGGDPNQVTIFGESAGSASVGFHLVSPMSKGLFSNAIMQSGSPLGNWAINREPTKQAKRFAAKFNCSDLGSEEMVACLKKLDAVTLVQAHQEMLLPLREKITLFVPSIEIVHDKNTFLGEEPLESLAAGRVNKVPLIIGVNKDEGLLSSAIITANQTKLQQANDEWNFFAPRILGYDPDRLDISDKIRKYYFGSAENIASIDFLANFTNLFSDRQFFVPVHRFVKQYAKHAPTRLYIYTYPAEFSLADVLAATQNDRLPAIASVVLELTKRWMYRKLGHELPHLGVCHGDELQLIFNWPLSAYITQDHKDLVMSKQIVKLWGDFVKNSDPIGINDIIWPAINPKASSTPLQYLNINVNPKMENEPFIDRIKFWDSIGL